MWGLLRAGFFDFLGRHPFFVVLFPFVLGILASGSLNFVVGGLALALGVVLGFRLRLLLLGLGFFSLGFFSGLDSTPTRACPLTYRTHYVSLIETTPTLVGRYYRCQAQILSYRDTVSGDWVDLLDSHCQINVDSSLQVSLGDVVLYRSTLYPFDSVYSSYYLNRGVEGRSYVYRLDCVDSLLDFDLRVERYRSQLSSRISSIPTSDSNSLAMVQALTIGVRDNLDWDIREAYRSSGASHLLAISGLHVGIIFGFLNFLLYGLRYWERMVWVRLFLVLISLWGYAFLTGMSASVVRSVIMFSVLQFGLVFSGRSLLNTLFISAFLMLVYNPLYLYDLGFQLSYLAMLGISLIYFPLVSMFGVRHRFWRSVLGVVLVSFSAQVATAPLVLFTFGEISVVGLLTNLGVWFTVPLIIVGGVLFLLTGWDSVGFFACWVAGLQNDMILGIGSLDYSTFAFDRMSHLALGISYLVIFLFVLFVNLLNNKTRLKAV